MRYPYGNSMNSAPLRPGDIICPNVNCGYQGPPLKTSRGSCLVGGLLLLLGIVPGVLYFVLRSGYRYNCPHCGFQIKADN
jgi:hypothetical protein